VSNQIGRDSSQLVRALRYLWPVLAQVLTQLGGTWAPGKPSASARFAVFREPPCPRRTGHSQFTFREELCQKSSGSSPSIKGGQSSAQAWDRSGPNQLLGGCSCISNSRLVTSFFFLLGPPLLVASLLFFYPRLAIKITSSAFMNGTRHGLREQGSVIHVKSTPAPPPCPRPPCPSVAGAEQP